MFRYVVIVHSYIAFIDFSIKAFIASFETFWDRAAVCTHQKALIYSPYSVMIVYIQL